MVVGLGLLVTIAGCTEPALVAAPSDAPPEYVSTYEPPAPIEVAPLRGTTVAGGSAASPALAAKIDNHPDARPQVGLQATDLVFEELVEGGLTRYVAVWQSDVPAEIGPVRSIRPMDPDIISPFGGIVAYSGGQERFVRLMQATGVVNAVHGQADTEATFFRTNTKTAPHNVLVKAPELIAEHSELAAPTPQFAFAADVASSTAARDGTPTATISYVFSPQMRGSWSWAADQSRFVREQGRGPDLDSAGAQLAATNVIVLRVQVTVSQDIPKTELIGSGEAWVSTGGGTVHATWSKATATSPIRLVDDAGITIRLGAGNSWIELVPLSGSVQHTG